MLRRVYIGSFFLNAALMSALSYYAYKFHWYWRFWWFDTIMHTLGAILVSSVTLWFFFLRQKKYAVEKVFVFAIAFAAISVIGVAWELFEFKFGRLILFAPHNSFETAKDLFFDGVGTILGALLFLKLYNGINET